MAELTEADVSGTEATHVTDALSTKHVSAPQISTVRRVNGRLPGGMLRPARLRRCSRSMTSGRPRTQINFSAIPRQNGLSQLGWHAAGGADGGKKMDGAEGGGGGGAIWSRQ